MFHFSGILVWCISLMSIDVFSLTLHHFLLGEKEHNSHSGSLRANSLNCQLVRSKISGVAGFCWCYILVVACIIVDFHDFHIIFQLCKSDIKALIRFFRATNCESLFQSPTTLPSCSISAQLFHFDLQSIWKSYLLHRPYLRCSQVNVPSAFDTPDCYPSETWQKGWNLGCRNFLLPGDLAQYQQFPRWGLVPGENHSMGRLV